MVDIVEESNTTLAVFELTPVMIPYFLGFFIFRGFYANFPIYLQIKQHLTDTQTVELWAIISGSGLFIGALTRLPAGLLSDRIGRIRAFMLAYGVYIIALFTILLSSNNILYILAMSVIRLGLNIITMTGRGVVSVARRDRGLKNGFLSSMVGIGSFIGPASLGYILEHYQPDTIIYASIVVILIDFGIFLIALNLVPRYTQSKYGSENFDLDLSGIRREERGALISGLHRPGVTEVFFLFFSAGMIFGLLTSVYTIYGYNILHMKIGFLGFITGAGSLVQAIWAPVVGKLYNIVRDEVMRFFAWGMIFLASFLMLFSASGEIYFIAGYFVLNFGNASYLTMEVTRLGQITEKEEFSFVFGLATSLIVLATAISGYISPLFYNIIPEGTFYGGFVFAIFSLILVMFTTRKWNNQRKLVDEDHHLA